MTAEAFARIQKIAMSLPEVTEKHSHGAPCFFLRHKKSLVYFHDAAFASDGRVSLWCRSTKDAQTELVASAPDVYFPPTPSSSGIFADWIGIFLDGTGDAAPDWDEIAEIVRDAYRFVAPKKLIALLDERAD